MRYEHLVQKVKHLAYFDEVFLNVKHLQALRNQFTRWVKQEKIIRLKKGLYTLPRDRQKINFSKMVIANILYSPSYISLEYALNHYGLIPERVTVVTSLSIHKTKQFQNALGLFSYRTIKRNLFFGYEKIQDEGEHSILIATPEKALLDKLYFDTTVRFEKSYFIENLRLQNFEDLNINKLKRYAHKMHSKKIEKMVNILIPLIWEERA